MLIVSGFDQLNNLGLVRDDDPIMGTNERMWLDKMNDYAYTVIHAESIPTYREYGWDSASNEAITSDLVDLNKYAVTDWILGKESNDGDGTLSAGERARIKTYLDNGGGLLISGSELAWDLEAKGRDPDFLHTVLRTGYLADDASTLTATSVAGAAFEGFGSFPFNAPDEYLVDYPDVLAPLNGASATLSYVGGTGGTAAVQASGSGGGGCERVIVMGFPFETVAPTYRSSMMDAALQFLDACPPPEAEIISPIANRYYRTEPRLEGIAFGEDLTHVEIQLLRTRDGLYWNGSRWDLPEIWLVATGAEVWSYPAPVLDDGTYVVRARAVGNNAIAAPVESRFTLDTIPPITPSVITPTGGITLTTPSVTLQCEFIYDSGSSVAYEFELDGDVYSTDLTYFRASVRSGHHRWRVRAYDLAGNISAWTSFHDFNTDPVEIFLPITIRSNSVDMGLIQKNR